MQTTVIFDIDTGMLKTLWNHREATQQVRRKTLEQECNDTGRKIEQLLDRIIDADSPLVAKALENRIDDLQSKKLVIEEKLGNCGCPVRPHEEMHRTSLRILQVPHKIWAFGRFEDKRAVLKLAFTDRLTYVRNEGYRTPDLSLPFRLLGDDFGQNLKMAP